MAAPGHPGICGLGTFRVPSLYRLVISRLSLYDRTTSGRIYKQIFTLSDIAQFEPSSQGLQTFACLMLVGYDFQGLRFNNKNSDYSCNLIYIIKMVMLQ